MILSSNIILLLLLYHEPFLSQKIHHCELVILLVFYSCVISDDNLRVLKDTFIISQFIESRCLVRLDQLLFQDPSKLNQGISSTAFSIRCLVKNTLQAHSGYWHNLFPCYYMTWNPSFLQAGGCLQLPEVTHTGDP